MGKKPKESRFRRLGKFEATILFNNIKKSKIDIGDYIKKFLIELGKYSFRERKRGEPENEGIVRELEDIQLDYFNVNNPVHYAKVVKERLHTKFQKKNTKREYYGFIKYLNELYWSHILTGIENIKEI